VASLGPTCASPVKAAVPAAALRCRWATAADCANRNCGKGLWFDLLVVAQGVRVSGHAPTAREAAPSSVSGHLATSSRLQSL